MARLLAVATGIVFAALFAAPASEAATLRFFESPSGNIACLVDAGGARCDIVKRKWKAPKRPQRCELDWGFALTVGKRSVRGQFACVGDTVRHRHAKKLAFGTSIGVGRLRCTSRPDGVRCVNGRGHGFFVSRQRYELF